MAKRPPRAVIAIVVLMVLALTLGIVYFGFLATDRNIRPIDGAMSARLQTFQRMGGQHHAPIAPRDEPGERLWLCLTFVDKATSEPLGEQSVHFYHTTAAGDYEPLIPGNESTARLSHSSLTDAEGRICVNTILPGDYGSSDDNRHIHMSVAGAKPVAYDIHFSQYSTFLLRQSVAGNDQLFLVELQRGPEGELVGYATVEVKRPAR